MTERLDNAPPRLGEILGGGLRLVWSFVRRRPWSFSIALVAALVFVATIVASAVVAGWITDSLILPVLEEGSPTSGRLLPAVTAIAIVAVWKSIAIVFRRAGATWLQFGTRADVRKSLVEHQLRLDLRWYDSRSTGDLLSVSEADTEQGTFVLAPFPMATGSLVLLIGTVVLVGATDLILGGVVMVGIIAMLTVDINGAYRTYIPFVDVQTARGRVSGIGHESIDGALTIKALGRRREETERFSGAAGDLRDKLIFVNSIQVGYQAVVDSLPTIITVLVLVLGALRLESGSVSAGELVAISYLISLLSLPVQFLGFVVWQMSQSKAAWSRVQTVLDSDSEVDHGDANARDDTSGAGLETSDVGFGYEADMLVLDGIEFAIEGGSTVAVVGPTGSGKSTLAMLLARLWDPITGTIVIDKRDVRRFARSELAGEVAYVAQDAFLFDDTVARNISLGVDIPTADVVAAAGLSGATGFIEELDKGFDTHIGERGSTLSGGQRQRIALARALVRRPRVLILDDATSAVDPSIELEILRGLRRSELPSTVVIVAYRKASIELADSVVFIDNGRIVAEGTHASLMESTPGYANLLSAYEEDSKVGDEQ